MVIANKGRQTGKSKKEKAFILEAIDEKPGLIKDWEQTVRELAGWMSHQEAEELRASLYVFNEISEGNWE